MNYNMFYISYILNLPFKIKYGRKTYIFSLKRCFELKKKSCSKRKITKGINELKKLLSEIFKFSPFITFNNLSFI